MPRAEAGAGGDALAIPRPPRRARVRHESWLDANEGLLWHALHAEAARLDAERRAVTARINVLRMRACQRALAASRRAVRRG